MTENDYPTELIGIVHFELINLEDAPKRGTEGGYEAWLEVSPLFAQGLAGIKTGDDIIILTWLHRAQGNQLMQRNWLPNVARPC